MSTIELRLSKRILPVLVKAIENRLKELELEISVTENRIKEFEQRYKMTSNEFLEKYRKGELGDNEEFIAWFGELEFLKLAKKEYNELKQVVTYTYRELSKENK